jgi:hypothetical protein
MNKRALCLVGLLSILVIACGLDAGIRDLVGQVFDEISPGNTTNDDPHLSEEVIRVFQEDVDQLRALFDSLPLPEHLMEEEPILNGDEFDIMSVFEILDHIDMQDGYKLAYVYSSGFLVGRPVIYALPTDQPPFARFEDYAKASAECMNEETKKTECDFLYHVQSDGSELGYLQMVILKIMGNQFYQYWHAEYNDAALVATEQARDDLLESISEPFIPPTSRQIVQAKRIDLKPQVIIGADNVKIRVVWFTKWGGFFESWITMNKTFPHQILERNDENLLEYDCGVMF